MDILQHISKILYHKPFFPLKLEMFYSTQCLSINARKKKKSINARICLEVDIKRILKYLKKIPMYLILGSSCDI